MTIDIKRIAHLRTVCGRESRAVAEAVDAQSSASALSDRLRSEIISLQRRDDDGRNTFAIANKRKELISAVEVMETAAQTVEIARERAASARKLRDRCEAYVAESVSAT